MGIMYPVMFGITNPVAIVMFPVVCVLGFVRRKRFGSLFRPQKAYAELDKHKPAHKQQQKHAKVCAARIGRRLRVFAGGLVLAMQTAITGGWEYVLFFGLAAIPAAIILVVSLSRLFKNPEEMFERIGN